MPLPLLAVADDAPVGTLPARLCASHRRGTLPLDYAAGAPAAIREAQPNAVLLDRRDRASAGSPQSPAQRIPWPVEGRGCGCGSRTVWPWRIPSPWRSCWSHYGRQLPAGDWR